MADPGIRLNNLPDLGTFTSDSFVSGHRSAGVGKFAAPALAAYMAANFDLDTMPPITAATAASLLMGSASGANGTFTASVLRSFVEQDAPLNVRRYGAVGDGTTDDTAAFQAAFTAAVAARKKVHIPAGRYRLTAQVTFAGSLVVEGDGMAESRLVWDSAAATSGIEGTLAVQEGFSQYCQFTDLALLQANPIAGTALRILSPTTGADRVSPRCVIERVLIRGLDNPNTNGWSICLDLNGVPRATVRSCVMIGKVNGSEPNYSTGHCVAFTNGVGASPHPTELLVMDCWLGQSQNGVYMSDLEGGFVSGCNIVGVNYGIQGIGPLQYPHISVQNCHINASVECIRIDKMFQAIIKGNLLYNQNSVTAGVMINLRESAGWAVVQGNIFENYNTSIEANCLVVTSATQVLIDGNIFRRSNSIGGAAFGTGIWLTAGATNCTVTDTNKFGPETFTQVLDSGTANVVASATMANPGGSRTNGGLEQKFGSVAVTLNAFGGGTVPFASAFHTALDGALVCSGDNSFVPNTQFAVIWSGSSISGLQFAVTPNPGAVSVRVNWVAWGH